MLSDMTDSATYLREIVQDLVEAEGLHPLARRTGLGIGQIRSICAGRTPLLSTVYQVCAALGYELEIRPREPAPAAPYASSNPAKSARFRRVTPEPEAPDFAASTPGPGPGPAPGETFERVADRHVAEILAAFADEYDAANGRTREALRIRFWHAYPDLRERAAARAGPRLARLAGGGRA